MDGRARSRSCSSRTPTASAPTARETVELRVATNPGMPTVAAARRRLRRRALAGDAGAQRARPAATPARTLVFDEIDAGVGGNTARAVGERLRALGEGRQVLCITHLPQVASLAATHFRIEKDAEAARRGRRSSGSTATSWSTRSSACSAPTAATRRRAATPASCSGRLSPGRAAAPRGRPPATVPHNRADGPAQPGAARCCAGPKSSCGPPRRRRSTGAPGSGARPRTWSSGSAPATSPSSTTPTSTGSPPRTWSRPGCGRWSTSRRPRPAATRTPGRCCSPAPGCRSSTRRRRRCSRSSSDGDRDRDRRRRGAAPTGACSRPGECSIDRRAATEQLDEQRERIDEALAEFAENTIDHVARGERAARRRDRVPADADRLPRPPRADRRPRRPPTARTCGRCAPTSATSGRSSSPSTAAPTRSSRRASSRT